MIILDKLYFDLIECEKLQSDIKKETIEYIKRTNELLGRIEEVSNNLKKMIYLETCRGREWKN